LYSADGRACISKLLLARFCIYFYPYIVPEKGLLDKGQGAIKGFSLLLL
jgi:hypothetical protein